MSSYDRADWHYGGNYPKGLPPENGGTHIGMFLAWAILHNFESEMHRKDSAESLRAVRERKMTGREFLFKECDEKFTSNDLNDEGNAFAKWYYDGDGKVSPYINDYDALIAKGLPSLYHAEDTWATYDHLAPTIDRRFAEWKQQGQKKSWWPF